MRRAFCGYWSTFSVIDGLRDIQKDGLYFLANLGFRFLKKNLVLTVHTKQWIQARLKNSSHSGLA